MMLMLAVLALASAQPPPVEQGADDPPTDTAQLQQMYDQSCAAREYGAYDDLCDQLSHQLKDARVEANREARKKALEARRRPAVKPAPVPEPIAPAPASAPPAGTAPAAP